MTSTTWEDVRKILNDIGDNPEVMNQPVIRCAEFNWEMDLVVNAKTGTMAFIDSPALEGDDEDGLAEG